MGLRVLALESRRAAEIAELIRRQGGEPFVAPAVREAAVEDDGSLGRFASRLAAGEFDMMVLLTGAGTRVLRDAIGAGPLAAALRSLTTVARGPKPAAVLREMNVPVSIAAPPPHTWREVLAATAGRPERRIAVQEHGRSNPELLDGLRSRGADVTAVRVYRWELPADTGPLREAAARLAAGRFDLVLLTSGVQVQHLLEVAAATGLEGEVRAALGGVVVASIGPSTTEMLEECGIPPDLEPSQGKMGILVREAAERAGAILEAKRGGSGPGLRPA